MSCNGDASVVVEDIAEDSTSESSIPVDDTKRNPSTGIDVATDSTAVPENVIQHDHPDKKAMPLSKTVDAAESAKPTEVDDGMMTTATDNEDSHRDHHHRHTSPHSDSDHTNADARGNYSDRHARDTTGITTPIAAAATATNTTTTRSIVNDVSNDSPAPPVQTPPLLCADPAPARLSPVNRTVRLEKRPIAVPPKARDTTTSTKRPRRAVEPEPDVASSSPARRVSLRARSTPDQPKDTPRKTLRRLDTQQSATHQQLVRNVIHVEKSAVTELLDAPQSFKYCGSCLACSRARCGRCWLCQAPLLVNNACVFRCCVINTDKTKKRIITSLDNMLLLSKETFEADMRVHVDTPRKKDELPWWGTVTGKGGGRRAVWEVKKDKDTNYWLPEKDLMDEYEFVLRQEKHRLARECELERAPNEKYSGRKVVGSRCYARSWYDNLWYWGVITQRAGRWYSILLENGVRLDKVLDLDIELETNALLRLQQAVQLRRAVFKHELLGKGYHRRWLDATWRLHEVVGKIVKCWAGNGPDNEKLFFTVEYCSLSASAHKHLPSADHNVAEFSAWGGHISFLNYMQTPPSFHTPFCYSWILPCTPSVIAGSATWIEGVELHSLELQHQGFGLELSIKKSTIAGAGFGLWVYCKRLSLTPPKTIFTLPVGHLLHIGTYGPVNDLDLKTDVIYAVKNFIHFGAASQWAYDCASHQTGYVDMTDDWTGRLHVTACQSLVAYTNEQVGTAENGPRSKMCVVARPDPCGVIHYYMGNESLQDGPIELPTGVAIELLMNYGTGYEKVRGARGYSDDKVCKVEGKKDNERKTNEQPDIRYILSRIKEYSIVHCQELLGFLTRLFSIEWDTPPSKRLRAFAVLLAVYNQVRSFGDVNLPMITTLGTMMTQCKDLVSTICAGWPKDQCLVSVLKGAHPLLHDVMVSAFGGNEIDWVSFASLDATQVRELLN